MQVENNTQTRNKKARMTETQRGQLQAYVEQGLTKSEMARKIGMSRGTIYAELKRGTTKQVKLVNGMKIYFDVYFASVGQKRTDANLLRSRNPKKNASVAPFIEYVDSLLLDERVDRSPDDIVGEAKRLDLFPIKEMVSTSTIYNYIDAGLMKTKNIDLKEKVSRKSSTLKKGRKNKKTLGKSIEERPLEVLTRDEFGHFEIDTVISQQDKEDDVLLTLIERKTRMQFIVNIDGKDTDSVQYGLSQIYQSLGASRKEIVKSITSDNGSEFASLTQDFSHMMEIYFTHPYASWERGTNENHHKLIRQTIPKGERIDQVSRKEIEQFAWRMNNKPRKLLDYQTPQALFEQELAKLTA